MAIYKHTCMHVYMHTNKTHITCGRVHIPMDDTEYTHTHMQHTYLPAAAGKDMPD